MYCKNCMRVVQDGQNYCNNCGAKLEKPELEVAVEKIVVAEEPVLNEVPYTSQSEGDTADSVTIVDKAAEPNVMDESSEFTARPAPPPQPQLRQPPPGTDYPGRRPGEIPTYARPYSPGSENIVLPPDTVKPEKDINSFVKTIVLLFSFCAPLGLIIGFAFSGSSNSKSKAFGKTVIIQCILYLIIGITLTVLALVFRDDIVRFINELNTRIRL